MDFYFSSRHFPRVEIGLYDELRENHRMWVLRFDGRVRFRCIIFYCKVKNFLLYITTIISGLISRIFFL